MEVLESMNKDVIELRVENEYLKDTFGFLRSVIPDYKDNPILGFHILGTLLGDKKLKSKVEGWIEANQPKKKGAKNGQRR
jgi:hypothetical protein